MEEQKKRNDKHFNLKSVHIFVRRFGFCPVQQSNVRKSCCLLVCLFVGGGISQRPNQCQRTISRVFIKHISRLYLFAMPLFSDRRGMICVSHLPPLLCSQNTGSLGSKCHTIYNDNEGNGNIFHFCQTTIQMLRMICDDVFVVVVAVFSRLCRGWLGLLSTYFICYLISSGFLI